MGEYSFPQRDVSGDRVYTSADFAAYYAMLYRNGVVMPVAEALAVEPNTTVMTIKIGAGAMVINGRMYRNTNDLILSVPVASSSQSRSDSVVIRLDLDNRSINAFYKTNDTSVTRNDVIYEMQLARVTVPANATGISQAMILDTRANGDVCGYSSPYMHIPVDGIVAQFTDVLNSFYTTSEADFDDWFANLQNQLNDNQVTNLQNQITILSSSLSDTNDGLAVTNGVVATKADNSAVVHNTGNETVSGNKTFSGTTSANNLQVTGTASVANLAVTGTSDINANGNSVINQKIILANIPSQGQIGNPIPIRRTGNVVSMNAIVQITSGHTINNGQQYQIPEGFAPWAQHNTYITNIGTGAVLGIMRFYADGQIVYYIPGGGQIAGNQEVSFVGTWITARPMPS
jgi:hypothetical protein